MRSLELTSTKKKLICVGLFMDCRLVGKFQIFHTDPYDNEYHFVHIMQHLQRISHDQNAYPLFHGDFTSNDTQYLCAYDLTYVKCIYETMIDHAVDPRIRAKYLGTWQMLRTRSAALLDIYVASNFDPRSISDFDWTEAFRRVGTTDGFYG
ncbi:MAG: hypothetical protein KGQ69_01370 [Rhodospirillales bacterium]|nr:hypothetical protein [Rhodospirillales bacterium]